MARLSFVILCLATQLGVLTTPASADEIAMKKYLIVTAQQANAQRVVRGVCLAVSEAARSGNIDVLEATRVRFSDEMNVLIQGDGEGFEGEKKSIIRSMLESVEKVWAEIDAEATRLVGQDVIDDEDLLILAEKSDTLTGQLDRIADMYTMDLLGDDSIDLDILRALTLAADQRTLIEMSTKKTCLANRGIYADLMRTDLYRHLQRFHKGVFALAFSSSSLSILPPPTEAIQYENFSNWQEWTSAQASFETALEENLTTQELADLSASTNWIFIALDEALASYQAILTAPQG